MNAIENINGLISGRNYERVGVFDHFWAEALQNWTDEGRYSSDDVHDHFDLDLRVVWGPVDLLPLLGHSETLEESDEWIVTRNGAGAALKHWKHRTGTPEHIDFAVKERSAWEALIKPKLTPERRRINFEGYRNAKRAAAEQERFFCWSGVNSFELMHPVCGHEFMLMGMATDPDWVRDMAMTYAETTIALQEILFAEEGLPDGIWYYEDMGFKQRPFMSPAMYRDIIKPAHSKTMDFAHSLGLQVIMHSCGFIEPLLADMVDAGIDCLQVMEVKAGMDPVRIKQNFGDRLSLFGGMDARNLVANDRAAIQAELQEKIPQLMAGFGYILHSDHSIPTTTDYETYRYFVDEGLRLGTY